MAALDRLSQVDRAWIVDGLIQWGEQTSTSLGESLPQEIPAQLVYSSIQLTPLDEEMLNGTHGKGPQVAMRVILRTAQIAGVTNLINVTQAHIDCCIYTGPATLHFAQQLRHWGAKVRIPTTLNAISIDQRLWRSQGVDPALGEPSEHLAQAYLDMSAQPTFTCAPYLLDSAPGAGENVIWGESNAVVFANSVLGARTIKCPDYLDVCAALTGRALNTGSHLVENRKARVEIHLEVVPGADESLFPLLGYIAGDTAADRVPIITGLEREEVTVEDLKAFGAAFATTSSAPMFHIAGGTIEARSSDDIASHLTDTCRVTITKADLARQWRQFNATERDEKTTEIDLISLGNPHFSHAELTKLLQLSKGRRKSGNTTLVVTCNRDRYSRAAKENQITALEAFGVQMVTDTCWCMIREPVIPPGARTIMTSSAKYAHYGSGLTGRRVRFGSLAQCVDAASLGFVRNEVPAWLGNL
jgi:predicted aconitase